MNKEDDTENVLSLRNVTKTYKLGKTSVRALRGIDLDIVKGSFCAIAGPSGCGKSTLLHIMGAMESPSAGQVVLNGRELEKFDERRLTRIRASSIGFIFQSFHLNPILTAEENVAIAVRFGGVKKRPAVVAARDWLERVGLKDRMQHYPSELSGGERQRVAIARALAKQPIIVLADEPTGNLDSERGSEILTLLRELNEQAKATMVLVTHDAAIAKAADRIVRIKDGRVDEEGGAS